MTTRGTIGFIGGGRATRFLLQGWQAAGAIPEQVLVTDCNRDVLERLGRDFPRIEVVAAEAAASCKVVILAVHPPVMPDVLEAIRPHVAPETVVMSLAPKIGCSTIASALGTRQVARMIPNAPSAIGRGFNPVAFGMDVVPESKAVLLELAQAWGEAPEVPEQDLEAYAILSAMGPTYYWFQWQALRELGVEFGLSPQAAERAILRMVEGAAECLLGAGLEASSVMDMIPVKPFADLESGIRNAYRANLGAIYDKLKS